MKKAAFLFFRVEVRNAACAVQYLVVVQTMLVRCPKNLDFTMFQKVSLSNLIFHCSRLRIRIPCPAAWIELHFELHNALQQFQLLKCLFLYRRSRHFVKIIVVAGVAGRHRSVQRPIGFMMKDRCLLPKCSFRPYGEDFRLGLFNNPAPASQGSNQCLPKNG